MNDQLVADSPEVLQRLAALNNRLPIWHRLAHKVDEGSAAQALKEHGLDYRIFRCAPKGWTIPTEELGLSTYPDLNPSATPRSISAADSDLELGSSARPSYGFLREATPNDPKPRFLFEASGNYGLVQNGELAQVADTLAAQTGWRVDSVGDLDSGTRFFISLDAGSSTIAGEDYRSYFMIADQRGGDGGIQVCYTPFRTYCANAISWAWRQATSKVRLIHSATVRDDLATVAEMFAQLRDSKAELDTALEDLAASQITDAEAQEIIDAAFPAPRQPRVALGERQGLEVAATASVTDKARAIRQSEKLRKDWARYEHDAANLSIAKATARSLYVRFGEEFPRLARTPYAAVQAVTELLDHGPGGDRGARAALLGVRRDQKQRAFDRAMSLA